MAPASVKRKRPERQTSEEDAAGRASPYRPEKSRMASRRASKGNAQSEEAGIEAQEADATRMHTRKDLNATDEASRTLPPTSGTQAASNTNGSGEAEVTHTASYPYSQITDDLVASWSDSGHQAVLDVAASCDELQMSDLLQEAVRSALDGRLSGQQAGHLVRDMITTRQQSEGPDVQFLFLNTLSFLYEANYKGQVLKTLLVSTGIDLQTIRLELDIPLLQDLGFVRSTFDRVRTRKTTNALYRQANFNLLREESEGYAKLITDYFNTAEEAFAKRHEEDPYMAEDAFQRVKALVGAFDLDVGRVLDITLDVSANLLVKAYPFFMKFYRASSWWPTSEQFDHVEWQDQGFNTLPIWALPGSGKSTASDEEKEKHNALRRTRDEQFWKRVQDSGTKAFFDLGARRIVDLESVRPILEQDIEPELDSRGKESNPNKRLRLNEDRKYMRETGCLPPLGNYDAAQLLGFKLRFYASDARDASDALPDNLIYLVALLIKIGFVSLRDLYPHLHPRDEDMPQEKARLEKEKAEKEAKERPGGGINALVAAGALSDDAPAPRVPRIEKDKSGGVTPAQDKKEEPKEELPTPANQKLLLLKALLLIGALPEALYILGRFPWLLELDVNLPPFLLRIARHMLSKITESLQPLSHQDGLQEPRNQLRDTSLQSDGTLLFSPRTLRKPIRWLHNDCFDKEGTEYRHYYSDWNDNIPVCQNLEDVYLLCDTFLGLLGPKIGQDVELYGTLLRLAERSMNQDSSSENRSRWLTLLRRLLVPALSCGKHNSQISQQLFELLKIYPTSVRYSIYHEWFMGSTSRLPDVRVAFARNKAEARDVLRRVSNETAKKQARALAKISLASPGIVMSEMISQLESYSNMIPSLVECTRFFSAMTYDVLTWTLINSLSGNKRGRMQGDGMLTSPWLQALAHFVATLFSKYTYLNPVPILQYLASKLRVGDTTDLEMFDQMLVEMAGIRSDVEFNDAQVVAMAGGEALQSFIMQQLSDTRHTEEMKKPSRRLIQALSSSGLTGQLLISIAQDRQIYPHHDAAPQAPLKVVGNNLDKISAVFAQYLEVLRTNLKAEDLEAAIPDVRALVQDFGLEPSIALIIRRMAIRTRMNEYDAAKKQEELQEKKDRSSSDLVEKTGDTTMTNDTANPSGKSVSTNLKTEALEEGEADKAAGELSVSPWHPVLEPVIQQLSAALPELASRISIPFYVTFWTLTHQDVLVPTDSYQRETNRIESQIKEINNDRSDVVATTAKKREERKRELQRWFDRLKSEPMQHMAAYMAVRNRISGSKTGSKIVPGENMYWFPKSDSRDPKQIKAENDAKHQALLQDCFLPRAILSAVDAHFSFEMLKLMHHNGTAGFSLMHLLFQLFKRHQLTAIIFQCTANEAQHFARFLWEILKLLHRWHAEKPIYEKEALGSKKKLPGFVKVFDENGGPKTVMDFETFRQMLYNFHAHLNAALQACFESGEYMHIRNGIIVLKGIHQVFPALKFMGKNMVDHIKKIAENDTRSDLKLAAMSLRGPLVNREKQWVMPQAFRLGSAKESAKSGSRPSSVQPDTPQLAELPKSNASAHELRPSLPTRVGRKASATGGPEDGEIEDPKEAHGTAKESLADTKQSTPQQLSEPRAPKSVATREPTRTDPKLSTPTPSIPRTQPHSSVPPRPESHITARVRDLPSRPEPAPYKPLPAPPISRPTGRYGARDDGRDDHYGRLERPGEVHPTSRDHSPGHRPGRTRTPPVPASRVSYREERPERPAPENRYGREDYHNSRREGPPQQSRAPEPHERQSVSSRSSDSGLHPDRMGIISSVAVAPDGQRVRAAGPLPPPKPAEAPVHVNPARLAMIQNDGPSTPNSRAARERPPPERDQRRERDVRVEDQGPSPSQPRSESRVNGRLPRSAASVASSMEPPHGRPPLDEQPGSRVDLFPGRGDRADDRGPRRREEERPGGNRHPSRERTHGESNANPFVHAHNGPDDRVRRGPPRDDRQLREERSRDVLREDPRDNDRGGRTDRRALPEPSREPPRDLQPRPEPQQDLAPRGPRRGGRLEMGPPQSESTYGRLNAPAEPPSGPKHGPVNQRRNFTAPQSANPSAPSPTTSRPPDSHTSFRGSSRQSMDAMGQGDRPTAPNSRSSTPANENGPAMHPSRAAAFAHPAPIQTNLPAPNGPRNNGGSPVHPPPSGPRGPGRGGPPSGTPTGPSPSNSSFPPSGPASADERQRRGDRQRANINATLQQGSNNVAGSNGQGVNFRGASSRQTSVSGPSAPSGPAGYRGQRREDDRGEIGPPPGNMDGRKRRHEDAQFEGVKRRRSAR